MDLTSLLLLATVTGYGDPVDGFPSHAERELLHWTNAARVAPEAFTSEYTSCSFEDFEESEQEPKDPLYIDLDLTEVSRLHSSDMRNTPCFQHESCDGTDTWTRIGAYYKDSSYLGENIAYGSAESRFTVMGMWMCSSGHRANIMNGDFNEMGPGVDNDYMTQDFAAGTLALGSPPVRNAVDLDGTIYADWGNAEAPVEVSAVLDGVPTELALAWGTEERGIFSGEPEITAECVPWYVWWETADGTKGTFPEQGSWQIGACDEDWIPEQALKGGLFGEVPEDELHGEMLSDLELVGCATVPIQGVPIQGVPGQRSGGAGAAMFGLGLALLLRRRGSA